MVKIVYKIGAVFVYWSKIVHYLAFECNSHAIEQHVVSQGLTLTPSNIAAAVRAKYGSDYIIFTTIKVKAFLLATKTASAFLYPQKISRASLLAARLGYKALRSFRTR